MKWKTNGTHLTPPKYLTKYMTPPPGHFIFNPPITWPKKIPTPRPPEYNRPPQLVINDSSLTPLIVHPTLSVHVNNTATLIVHFTKLTLNVDHVDRNTVSTDNVKFLISITRLRFDQNLTCYGQKWSITHSRSWIRALTGTRTFMYLNLCSDTDPDTIKSRHHDSAIWTPISLVIRHKLYCSDMMRLLIN